MAKEWSCTRSPCLKMSFLDSIDEFLAYLNDIVALPDSLAHRFHQQNMPSVAHRLNRHFMVVFVRRADNAGIDAEPRLCHCLYKGVKGTFKYEIVAE